MLVAHSFLPDGVGGTEVYTYQLARALVKNGHDVTVVAAIDSTSHRRYSVIRTQFEGLRVVRIVNSTRFATSFKDYFVDAVVDELFRRIVLELQPDVIHFQHTANLSGGLPETARQLHL